jgi:hypothetical protein
MKTTNNGYFSRWGAPWDTAFENKVSDARRYLTDIRELMTRNYLPGTFNGTTAALTIDQSDLCDVTISAVGQSGASIKINSVTPNIAGGWTGKYYKGIPITLTATPAPGSNFEWIIHGGTITSGTSTSQTITVNLSGNAVIVANYQVSSTVADTGITITNKAPFTLWVGRDTKKLSATVTPGNATFKTVIWSSSDTSVAVVDSTGLVTPIGAGTAVITATSLSGFADAVTVTVKAPRQYTKMDLAAALATAAEGVVWEWGLPEVVGGGSLPIRANGTNAEVKYTIINESGTKKLKVENYGLGAPGFTIEAVDGIAMLEWGHSTGFNFEVGDTIQIIGRFDSYVDGAQPFILNLAAWDWDQLQGWSSGTGDFNKTFDPLTQADVNKLMDWSEPYIGCIKISTGGISPWSGNRTTPISTFVIEQIKITGLEYDYE